jgi:hypothetical protein
MLMSVLMPRHIGLFEKLTLLHNSSSDMTFRLFTRGNAAREKDRPLFSLHRREREFFLTVLTRKKKNKIINFHQIIARKTLKSATNE